jgi:hypothetical protein
MTIMIIMIIMIISSHSQASGQPDEQRNRLGAIDASLPHEDPIEHQRRCWLCRRILNRLE